MARRSQCSSAGDSPLDPNYLPPHYREEYRLAIDTLVEEDLEGYYQFLQKADVVDFLSTPEIQYIQDSVQVPQQSSSHPEQHFLETGGDGSSDTYWPVHSDLDAPGLDLGWPQMHPFICPTEVTTLVNPPEPDMPSIKEQARRLIKNAQQVIGIVMDMFTDVDMFADILNAATRNVAVYIILDEQNAHHFVNMVSNCRVVLQNIPFLRVRTVSGITYQCRSGKSFKGQMMDRFLLTDCRAVLSGNYSFMWSFEKLHRCMAHLFLGQLVSTFDEEFRILYAQSQPLLIENVLAPVEDLSILQKRQYPSERRLLYREPRKFLSLDTGNPDEWGRPPQDERMDADWRMAHLKRQESLRGPADLYSRFPSQQARVDPPFDQGPSRIAMMDNPAFKRHSYAEGIQGRYSFPFLQPQVPDSETQGRHFHRGQPPYPGPEAEYTSYDKFWNQDYLSTDQYSEPGVPPEMHPGENFDPVLNYLSSTRNRDFDQSSENLLPAADLPFGSSHPRRLSLGQTYACQTSPTPSNTTDQKPFFQEPYIERKDPMVKRGLRNWRISSFLSAYDNPTDEGPPQAHEPLEEPTHPTPAIELPSTKIPNVREFKVPAVPRVSQMPSYVKTAVLEQPKKLPDEPAVPATETKTTPSPSPTPSSSSTTEGDKMEEAEQKEPKTIGLRREDSFRRKYNAAKPRSSRLRSSLIFSSMDQQDPKTSEQEEETEAEQTKLPFVSHVLGQRRSATREPFEWSRYIKSNTFDNSAAETSKPDDGSSKGDEKDSTKEEKSENIPEIQLQHADQANLTPSVPPPKPAEAELPRTDQQVQPDKPLLSTLSFVDMSDPDQRLMFFKEMAAKRKAAEAEKSKGKSPVKPPAVLQTSTAGKKEDDVAKEHTTDGLLERTAAAESAGETSDGSKEDSRTPQSCEKEQNNASAETHPVSAEAPQRAGDPRLPDGVCQPAQRTDESSHLNSTSEEPNAIASSSLEISSNSSPPEAETSSDHVVEPLPQTSDLTPASSSSDTIPGDTIPADKSEVQESVTSSAQEPPKSAEETSDKSQNPSTQAHLDSVSQLTSSAIPSAVVQVESDISPDVCAAGSETNVLPLQSTAQTDAEESETDVCVAGKGISGSSESEMYSFPEAGAESSEGLGLSYDVTAESPSVPEPVISALEGSVTETITLPEHPPSETSSYVNIDSTSQSETPTHAAPPAGLVLTGSDVPSPAETLSCSPLTDTAGSVLSPEGKKAETNMFDTNEAPPHPSSPAEPPSEAPAETDPPSKTPESGAPEIHASEKIPEDTSGTQESASSEKPDDSVKQNNVSDPTEVTSKQPKSSQSRYHSSTANVLSSSNLRDDTKLLLEQISANSQNRSEAAKESPVTDDEKEDEADKTAQREKERGMRTFSRGQHKSSEEREKLLERIQSMRKDRKVYSRFEMAP
ncbi:protein FAM83H [Parambassis ranga]|uniref:Protein FAM83H n=1 Tax=Parambassis ranga TaxID=210632 RepID=A0A6P7JP33_9TELE|nr:protein FAM83H-like [Parambassis ranga]